MIPVYLINAPLLGQDLSDVCTAIARLYGTGITEHIVAVGGIPDNETLKTYHTFYRFATENIWSAVLHIIGTRGGVYSRYFDTLRYIYETKGSEEWNAERIVFYDTPINLEMLPDPDYGVSIDYKTATGIMKGLYFDRHKHYYSDI